ncbi:MAG: HypC/HybG/HupF family hydrogenase formation chaperone [Methanomassiliicoccales archaeon]|nr:HypC/HybG/HupF family hydrogenase formation chaperone [Methanomassiliicoccales archaeon]
MPAKILSINGDEAEVDFGGAVKRTNISMVDAKVGEYVIIHAGFAIQKVDEEEARETLQLWNEFLEDSEVA